MPPTPRTTVLPRDTNPPEFSVAYDEQHSYTGVPRISTLATLERGAIARTTPTEQLGHLGSIETTPEGPTHLPMSTCDATIDYPPVWNLEGSGASADSS
jgi:hypothetical protein